MRNKTALAQPHCAPCMMAAGVVRAAIASILLDKDFELNTPRMVVAKETAQMLLDVSTGDDMGQDRFESFAITLNGKLETLATPTSSKQLSTQKQHLWSSFHSFRVSELRCLWKDLFASLGVDAKFAQDPLLGEYVNDKLFGEHVKAKFEVEAQCVEPTELTENDLNALRYAAGYVPWKLSQKFKKPTCKHPNRQGYLVCLASMSESAEEEIEDTYLEYTKKWIRAVDRGGLFRIVMRYTSSFTK